MQRAQGLHVSHRGAGPYRSRETLAFDRSGGTLAYGEHPPFGQHPRFGQRVGGCGCFGWGAGWGSRGVDSRLSVERGGWQ